MRTIKRVKLNSKKGQIIANTINSSMEKYGYRMLSECYTEPSEEKQIENYKLIIALNQSPLSLAYIKCGIVSYNQNHFSVGLKTYDNEHYIYITKDYIYYVDIDFPPVGIWNI